MPHVNSLSTVLVATHGGCESCTASLTKQLDLPAGRIMGLGTVARTLELRRLIGQAAGVNEREVAAFVTGTDGPQAKVQWESARIAGLPIEAFALDANQRGSIEKQVLAWSASDVEFEHAVHLVTEAIAALQGRVLSVCVCDDAGCESRPHLVRDNVAISIG